tara:strand:+ start:811 stop:2457 length:1647 start_codon:yes stop_codon:yes gene_type:complete
MSQKLKIFLAQMNPIGGDIDGNFKKLKSAWERASILNADIVVAPEMFLSGYPIDDLVLREDFLLSIEKYLDNLSVLTVKGPAIICGAPRNDNGILRNSVFIMDKGEIIGFRDKAKLPNEDEFYDNRQFMPGDLPGPILLRGIKFGIPICQDIWDPEVCECLTESGAEIILSINGSTFNIDKKDKRLNTVVSRAVENQIPFIYLNSVGGQDELIFDGGSFAINMDGKLACQLPMFETFDGFVEIENKSSNLYLHSNDLVEDCSGYESLYSAILLSLRDYVYKNGFSKVIFGLSGGIDSALVAMLCVDALGPENVNCFMLPSKFTSKASNDDAINLANKLNIELENLSIEDVYSSIEKLLNKKFNKLKKDITEENIQSRVRALILMAMSNKFGSMLVSTSNKSESAVGYSTLYGDMSGGFSPLKDVWKTDVIGLCYWRNKNIPSISKFKNSNIIPENIITKPPTAELRENQKDTDTLPEYEKLDKILSLYMEEMKSENEIIREGYDRETVIKIINLLRNSEYKRFQAPPGPKLGKKAFGRDRMYPLTNKF